MPALGIVWTFISGGFRRMLGALMQPVQLPLLLWLAPALAAAWFWHIAHLRQHRIDSISTQYATYRHEADQRVAEAKAATASAEQKAKENADDADSYHAQLMANQQSLRDYIAAHRVQPPATPAATSTGASSHPDTQGAPVAPAVPTVAVPDAVVTGYDACYDWSLTAYKWTRQLVHDGLAKDKP